MGIYKSLFIHELIGGQVGPFTKEVDFKDVNELRGGMFLTDTKNAKI